MEPADRVFARCAVRAEAAKPLTRFGIERPGSLWLGLDGRFAGGVHVSEDCSRVVSHARDFLPSSGQRILTASSGGHPRSASSISA